MADRESRGTNLNAYWESLSVDVTTIAYRVRDIARTTYERASSEAMTR